MTTLVWFRQDFRVSDNPALHAAAQLGSVVPVCIFAPHEEQAWQLGGASRWWLHQSLQRLAADLKRLGSQLILRVAEDSLATLQQLAQECGASRVFWNRRYEPATIARDHGIRDALRAANYETRSFNGALLHEPWEIKNKSGGPFQVFTPYWRHCIGRPDPPEPLPTPRTLNAPDRWPTTVPLDAFALQPKIDWAAGMRAAWEPGSKSAKQRLERFLEGYFDQYPTTRDQPGVPGTSMLSPHLHFGEISPREVWHAVRRFALNRGQHTTWRDSTFLKELGWREFAHHLLFFFPETTEKPLRAAFARFPWKPNETALHAWQRGQTGYPLVDAGMRQLWQSGWMHNRVRMLTGSFLVKHLLLSWNEGAHWFWDTLVDADLAANTLNWQWVAGCGADASPYFRIFNPTTQASKFDPDGTYIRRWVPELAQLPPPYIHEPWVAPPAILQQAGVVLGKTYPRPIVDHAQARVAALAALATLRD